MCPNGSSASGHAQVPASDCPVGRWAAQLPVPGHSNGDTGQRAPVCKDPGPEVLALDDDVLGPARSVPSAFEEQLLQRLQGSVVDRSKGVLIRPVVVACVL